MGTNGAGTNGTAVIEPGIEEDRFARQTMEYGLPLPTRDRTPAARYASDNRPHDASESGDDFVLAPLVDKIAFGIARGLVVAMKELEQHIASETRKVGDTVGRRLDALQTSLRDNDARQTAELEKLRTDAREFSASVSQRIESSTAALREADARQSSDLEALRAETRAFATSVSERIDSLCADLGVQQEDIAAVKGTFGTLGSRVDALVERLDRQAEAVRLMHTNYSQRETELEQLVNGIARLRAFPTPLPAKGL
jgi:hypothetical protein